METTLPFGMGIGCWRKRGTFLCRSLRSLTEDGYAVVEEVVKDTGFASSEETGKDGDG